MTTATVTCFCITFALLVVGVALPLAATVGGTSFALVRMYSTLTK